MSQDVLEHLYQATEEDLLYGIGTLPVADSVALPLIHVHYRHWSREKLIVVRASFASGPDLVIGEPSCGCREMRLSTREQVSVQVKEDGHTHVLRAPAWDACLDGVAEHVIRRFERDCRQAHGYVLLMQTPAWEFLTAVERACGRTHVQPITARAYPCPPMAPRLRCRTTASMHTRPFAMSGRCWICYRRWMSPTSARVSCWPTFAPEHGSYARADLLRVRALNSIC